MIFNCKLVVGDTQVHSPKLLYFGKFGYCPAFRLACCRVETRQCPPKRSPQKNGRQPQKERKKWKTTYKKMKDDLKKNERQPKKNGRQHKKMGEILKKK
jgi:hypothetical protein